MASRIEEFDEKILACAKEEFLEKAIRMPRYGRLLKMPVSVLAQYIRGIRIKRGYFAFLLNQQLTA